MRPMSVRVGQVEATVRLQLIEMVEIIGSRESPDLGFDGLLGMDILRACVLALDDKRFLVRCRRAPPAATSFNLGAMRGPLPKQSIVLAGKEMLPLLQHADGSYDWTGRHLAARIRKDGTVAYSKPRSSASGLERMDADDERRWFEEQTRDLLINLAQTHDRKVILDALAALPRYLEAILDDTRFTLAQRRHVFFLLWDEMAEPDARDRGWAGTRARALIDTFIQQRLPAGASGGYSADELAKFNRARAKGPRFDPYAPTRQDPDRDPLNEPH
jgi:hypothetical protein